MARLVYSKESKKQVHESIVKIQKKARNKFYFSLGLNVVLSVIIVLLVWWR